MPACSSNNGADTAMKQRISCLPALLLARSFACTMWHHWDHMRARLGRCVGMDRARARQRWALVQGIRRDPRSIGTVQASSFPVRFFSFLFGKQKHIRGRLCCWSQALNNGGDPQASMHLVKAWTGTRTTTDCRSAATPRLASICLLCCAHFLSRERWRLWLTYDKLTSVIQLLSNERKTYFKKKNSTTFVLVERSEPSPPEFYDIFKWLVQTIMNKDFFCYHIRLVKFSPHPYFAAYNHKKIGEICLVILLLIFYFYLAMCLDKGSLNKLIIWING